MRECSVPKRSIIVSQRYYSDDLFLCRPHIDMWIHSVSELCDCVVDTVVRLGKRKADQMRKEEKRRVVTREKAAFLHSIIIAS